MNHDQASPGAQDVIARMMAADHARLDQLLGRAATDPACIQPILYREFPPVCSGISGWRRRFCCLRRNG